MWIEDFWPPALKLAWQRCRLAGFYSLCLEISHGLPGEAKAILILPACLRLGASYFNSRSIIRAVRYGQRWAA